MIKKTLNNIFHNIFLQCYNLHNENMLHNNLKNPHILNFHIINKNNLLTKRYICSFVFLFSF